MRRDVGGLLAVLVVTNAAWFAAWRGAAQPASAPEVPPEAQRGAERRGPGDEGRTARTRPRAGTQAGDDVPASTPRDSDGAQRPGPATGATTDATTAPSPLPESKRAAPPSVGSPLPAEPATDPARRKQALEALTQARADVLQNEDLVRRERGLVAVEDGLRSPDAMVAASAMGFIGQFKGVAYDRRRFREPVFALLARKDRDLTMQAAMSFQAMEREPGDGDRVLALADDGGVPSDGLLVAGLWLNSKRAEGKLSDLFVRALGVTEPRDASERTANLLRGMQVSGEVESAVVTAWRRRLPDVTRGDGFWPFVFGQMEPVREVRVRAILELLGTAGDKESARQLAGVALWRRPVDAAARPVAAQLALDAFATAPDDRFRKSYVDIARVNGASANAARLRMIAEDASLSEEVRKHAAAAADELERR